MRLSHFWKIARDTRDTSVQHNLSQFTQQLLQKKEYDLAALYSSTGLEIMGGGLADDVRNSLITVRSKSMVVVGSAIPVPRTDPRYPVFSAQALDPTFTDSLGRALKSVQVTGIAIDGSDGQLVFDPGHPDADAGGI